MKVRISANKIRFRLKQYEVDAFANTGVVTEALQFGTKEDDQLKFTLRKEGINRIEVRFYQQETTVLVPLSLVTEWTSTELVGFNAVVDTGKGKNVSILVEKD